MIFSASAAADGHGLAQYGSKSSLPASQAKAALLPARLWHLTMRFAWQCKVCCTMLCFGTLLVACNEASQGA